MTPRRPAALGLLSLALALLALHCRSNPEGPAAADAGAAPAPPVTPAPETAPPGPPVPLAEPAAAAKIQALVDELPRRGRCTLVAGCPAADALVREGRSAAPALVALYRRTGGDKYWRQRVLDLLGRGGDEAAVAFLRERLEAPDELLRVDVALALGHRKAAAAEAALVALHDATAPADDRALRLATAYALARLGRAEARAEIHAALDPEETAQLNAGQLRTLLTIVRWLDERGREDVRAFLRRALADANPILRREAVRLVRDWSLREAVPALIPLVEDASAGVRDLALETLRELTGQRHKRTREQWESWCRETGCGER